MPALLSIIQDYLLPPTCLLCGSMGFAGQDLCQGCYGQLPRHAQRCPQCAAIFSVSHPDVSICGDCLRRRPQFDHTHTAFSYAGSVRYLILRLKFGGDYKNARLLGSLLAESLPDTEKPDCLIPVPLHKNRYRQRGFNQSLEIARVVAKQRNIALRYDICQRHRSTKEQGKLNAKQRHSNVKNSFALMRPAPFQHIVLIDDVMTTGSTVNELARLFKQAGVPRVDVWVCARA